MLNFFMGLILNKFFISLGEVIVIFEYYVWGGSWNWS